MDDDLKIDANIHSCDHCFQNPPPEDEVGRFGTDTNLEHVVEHGILFQMPMDKWNDAKNPPATYWVVGWVWGQILTLYMLNFSERT